VSLDHEKCSMTFLSHYSNGFPEKLGFMPHRKCIAIQNSPIWSSDNSAILHHRDIIQSLNGSGKTQILLNERICWYIWQFRHNGSLSFRKIYARTGLLSLCCPQVSHSVFTASGLIQKKLKQFIMLLSVIYRDQGLFYPIFTVKPSVTYSKITTERLIHSHFKIKSPFEQTRSCHSCFICVIIKVKDFTGLPQGRIFLLTLSASVWLKQTALP